MLKLPEQGLPLLRMRRTPKSAPPRRGGSGKGKSARANGATRKSRKAARSSRQSASAWFNRMLLLTGAVVVTAAGIEAYLTL